jgi:hypothetical protein
LPSGSPSFSARFINARMNDAMPEGEAGFDHAY